MLKTNDKVHAGPETVGLAFEQSLTFRDSIAVKGRPGVDSG
jgi:hypothetical protein